MFGILYLVFMCALKVVSNYFGTVRIILTQKNKAILASILLFLCSILDYVTTKAAVQSNMVTIIALSVACGVGCYIAMDFSAHHSKDRTYVNVIMNDDTDAMMDFHVFLMKNHVVHTVADTYARNCIDKTLTITAFAETKSQSRLIDEYIENSPLKFKRMVQ